MVTTRAWVVKYITRSVADREYHFPSNNNPILQYHRDFRPSIYQHHLLSHSSRCSQWQCHHSRDLPLPSQTTHPLLAQSSKNTSWTLKTSKTLMRSQSHLQSHLQSLPHHKKFSRLSYQVSCHSSITKFGLLMRCRSILPKEKAVADTGSRGWFWVWVSQSWECVSFLICTSRKQDLFLCYGVKRSWQYKMWLYLKREDESGPRSPRLCEERVLGPFWLCCLFHFPLSKGRCSSRKYWCSLQTRSIWQNFT